MTSLRQYPANGDRSPEAMDRLAKHHKQVLEVVEAVNRQWVEEEAARLERERLEKGMTSAPAASSTVQPEKPRPVAVFLLSRDSLEYQQARLAGSERLKQLYSSSPLHQAKAAADPEYWLKFFDSQPNS
jgi:hypothetical protein